VVRSKSLKVKIIDLIREQKLWFISRVKLLSRLSQRPHRSRSKVYIYYLQGEL